MTPQTDRIEKRILLRAPRERVWSAISQAKQFGTWFGMAFDGEFAAGTRLSGKITPTKVDAEVAQAQASYAGMPFEIAVDRIEPMRLFSFRWHPYAVEPDTDYSSEPMTLVSFELEEAAEGTWLTITESGFDKIPLARRAEAFTCNEQGWEAQTRLIERYLALQ
jgi:uncharacterized protein YndB with AHSA1/START domain